MSWLIDLIVSNLWLFILLYAAVTSFTKSSKKEKDGTNTKKKSTYPRPKQSPVWESDWSSEDVFPESPKPAARSKVYGAMEESQRAPEQFPEKREPRIREESKNKREGAASRLNHPNVATPVQGMIWSQVYGPPRSKQPHRTMKK